MRRLAIIPLAALLLSSASAATAPRLTVSLGRSARLPIEAPALNVIVGDPGVADVVVVDRRTLVVHGKAYGRSEIIALGAGGQPVWQGEVAVVAADAGSVIVHRGTGSVDYSCAASYDCSPRIPAPSAGQAPSSAPSRAVSGNAPVHH